MVYLQQTFLSNSKHHNDNLVASKVVSTKENKGENIFKMRRQYSCTSAVSMADARLKRTITRFE